MSSSRRVSGVTRRSTKPGFTKKSMSSAINKALAEKLERKHLDTWHSIAPSTAGSLTELNQISQGNTVSTRVGNKINYKSLVIRMAHQCDANTNSTLAVIRARFMIILWRPNSTPTVGNILHDTASSTKMLFSPHNKEYKASFSVLYDSGCTSIHPLYGDSGATFQNAGTFIETTFPLIVKPLTNVSATYDGSSSTDSNNRLYLFEVSDVAGGTVHHLNGYSTISWTDA